MDEGWLKLHRKTLDSEVFREDPIWRLFTYLLLRATYTRRQLVDGTWLEPGELICSYRRMAEYLGWTKKKVEHWMRRLGDKNSIRTRPIRGTRKQVITICNWDTYQSSNTLEGDSKGDSEGDKQGDTEGDIKKKERKKERKKGRNVRNVIPPELTNVAAYCTERKNGIDPQDFLDHYTRQGWKLSNGVKMTDWQAAVRTWERNQKDDRKQPKLFGTKGPTSDGPCEAI